MFCLAQNNSNDKKSSKEILYSLAPAFLCLMTQDYFMQRKVAMQLLNALHVARTARNYLQVQEKLIFQTV